MNKIEEQARYLAQENKLADPSIRQVYWFPDEEEVRLIETTDDVPDSEESVIRPFYFQANPSANLPAPTGIALIRPNEVKQLKLPARWGSWEEARKLLAEAESK